MLSIGNLANESQVVVAPMAGVTDRPFRDLCRRYGTFWAVSEMVTSDTRLWHTRKSRHRLAHADEAGVSWVQLAGAEPAMMAEAARMNVDLGAEIIDINMGCPAKKVCNRAAGSALLRDERLVTEILNAVVSAVEVPVTLKIRLGWSREEMNAVRIGRIAEVAGIRLLTVHGRTRACKFQGEVDYAAIGEVKAAIAIPVVANGDIDSPQKAAKVLALTGADGVMIGRAAQGRPWLPAMIDHYLQTGELIAEPTIAEIQELLVNHVSALHDFYGDHQGLRIARKHVGWALDYLTEGRSIRQQFNRIETCEGQLELLASLHQLPAAA